MVALLAFLATYGLLLLPAVSRDAADFRVVLHASLLLNIAVCAIVVLGEMLVRLALRRAPQVQAIDFYWYATAAAIGTFTAPIYGIFKQFVLPARGFPLDPYLARMDRIILGGHDAWQLSQATFGMIPAASFIDGTYTAAVAGMMLFPALCVAFVRAPVERARLIGCWLACWILIGSLAAWLLGSAGPCYYDALVAPNASFHQLDISLDAIARHSSSLGFRFDARAIQLHLLDAYRSGRYTAGAGISAAPSMHVAMVTLFAIAGYQVGRWPGYCLTAFAALIWIGSMYLGWHYATGGLIAVALMLSIWRSSAWVVARLGEATMPLVDVPATA